MDKHVARRRTDDEYIAKCPRYCALIDVARECRNCGWYVFDMNRGLPCAIGLYPSGSGLRCANASAKPLGARARRA
jgi:hypothetical protein